jgi:hypothetical protein
MRDESMIITGELPVSTARRSAGRVIAITLLAVLIVGAVWFVAHQILSRVGTPSASAPGL